MSSNKIKLVLSGSGTRYPCFIGAIKRLLEEGYEIEEICGTSGGAIVAAGFASNYEPDKPEEIVKFMTDMALEILPRPLMDINAFPFFRKGFFAGKKILRALEKHLPDNFSDTKIPVRIVTFNNNLARHKIWSSEDNANLPLCVRASMGLPGIFDLVNINGDWHSDGGIVGNFELDVFGTEITNVFGVTFAGLKTPHRREVRWKKDIIQAHIDGAIEENMLEDIEDISGAPICYIKTVHQGLNLKMNQNDVLEQILEGYLSMDNRIQDLYREKRSSAEERLTYVF